MKTRFRRKANPRKRIVVAPQRFAVFATWWTTDDFAMEYMTAKICEIGAVNRATAVYMGRRRWELDKRSKDMPKPVAWYAVKL